jgi:hypothetical protein
MIKYILTMFIFVTFLMADKNQPTEKPIPTITINDDDKVYAGRKRGKKHRGRRRGGSGLR